MTTTAALAGANKIFRQAALDRLSSPEQLDRLITIPAARDWWGAGALGGLLVIAVIWGVFGTIPTRVTGPGILIASGGQVYDAFALGDGVVEQIFPKLGERISLGDLVARVSQPEIVQSLVSARAVVEERTKEFEDVKVQTEKHAQSREQNNMARRRALQDKIAEAERREKELQRQAETETRMFSQHLITWQKLYETRDALATARQVPLDSKSQLEQIEADEIAARNNAERDVVTASDRLTEAKRQVVELEQKLQLRSRILSPAAGKVTEFKAVVGGRVATGTAVISIESGVTGLELILYLPPDQGKQVKPGMEVHVSPSTVKREEYGTVIGTVRDVSEFPATTQAMAAILQNDALVRQFSPQGSPFAARIELTRDSTTPTGYSWSGGVGPETTLSSGTIATAEVTVRQLPPVAYIIPLLRKYTGLDD
jgi:HlyD family secretion protein